MKKNYLKPNTNMCKIQLASMITGSVGSISKTEAAAGSSDGPVNYSRGNNSFWDDDEE